MTYNPSLFDKARHDALNPLQLMAEGRFAQAKLSLCLRSGLATQSQAYAFEVVLLTQSLAYAYDVVLLTQNF
jgi:hypothetical protein